jgi:tetratricopeptide repeat protein
VNKRDDVENMQVVEIDAIDFGDWERNMKTSEVEMTHLRTLIRETAAQPIVAEPPRVATIVAPAPAPPPARVHAPPATARPSLLPAPAPEPEDHAIDLRPRFPMSRALVLVGAGLAGVLVVVAMIVLRHSPAATRRAPTAPQVASATPVAQPPAPQAEATPPPATTPRKTPMPAPAKTSVPAPAAHPAPSRVAAAPAAATKRVPVVAAKEPARPKTGRGVRPSRKTVAVRTALPPAAPAVEPDTMERARTAYAEGNDALFAGDSDAAIKAYKEVLELSPTFAFGQRGLGLAYAQKGDNAAAVKALREYLKLEPKAKDVPLIKKRIRSLQAAKH